MGGSSINYSDLEKHYKTKGYDKVRRAEQVFTSYGMYEPFNPATMKLPREACDSAESPRSRGIIFAEDVTGSMGRFLLSLIQNEFPRLIKSIYANVPYNPHIMFMGVGDVEVGDSAPLQVTQFETDLRMLEQLEKIYLEKGGGSNAWESYILPWYFAGKHIEMDCFNKRREKGFLFTFGDEHPTPSLSASHIRTVFGSREQINRSVSAYDCLEMASEKFYCYHIVLHGSRYGYDGRDIVNNWRKLMGSHVCDLGEHECLPELVSTILKMYEGVSKTDAIASINDTHARIVVAKALLEHEEYVEASCVAEGTSNIEVF